MGQMGEKNICRYYLMKTEQSLCIHEASSILFVSCKYLYECGFPTEDFGDAEAALLEAFLSQGCACPRAPGEPQPQLLTERCSVVGAASCMELLMSA